MRLPERRPPLEGPATLYGRSVRTLVDTAHEADGSLDLDKATRLAWRPAWSIRSRRGALRALFDMLRQRG